MKNSIKSLTTLFVCLFFSISSQAQNHPELGMVEWIRDYDLALKQAKDQDKPIALLFQEIPGCATCVNYGKLVLSNPLLVEALENEFVPLAIFNNKGGTDKNILEKYNEPSWNNPVMRIIDHEGENITKRLSGNYSELGLANYLIQGLQKNKKDVPKYLHIAQEELEAKSKRTETVYYQMYCFWSGEAHLGKLEGVIETAPGFMNHAEVVKVVYDPSEIEEKEITQHAKKAKCQLVENVNQFRIDKDPQYYLKNSDYKYLALSPLQKTKINTALANGKSGEGFLSPKQLKILNEKNFSSMEMIYYLDFKDAWDNKLSN